MSDVIHVRSIAQPLVEMLSARPFEGEVRGAYAHACNALDEEGRVLTLAAPRLGNGPFSIVVVPRPGLFEHLHPGQRVDADGRRMTVGAWQFSFEQATVWDPRLPRPPRSALRSRAIATILDPYLAWPLSEQPTRLARQTRQRLAEAATALQQALRAKHGHEAALGLLVGLGAGLTPAGDDYLLGVLAALWLTGQTTNLSLLVHDVLSQTTALSAAYLKAATSGHFAEPWHALSQAFATHDHQRIGHTVHRVSQQGASSGRDALAGFADTLLHARGTSNAEQG